MKQLQCEMCGSTDILKQGGVFVCQSCGVKYSVEEAKKMLDNSVVEVTGKVRIDPTGEIANWHILAERAKDEETKLNYYHKILEKDATDWKANFYIDGHYGLVFESGQKAEKELKDILISLDNKTKSNDSEYIEGIHFLMKYYYPLGLFNPKDNCSFFTEELFHEKNDYIGVGELSPRSLPNGQPSFEIDIEFLKVIAECVDNRYQGAYSDIGVEVYKLLEKYLRTIFNSPKIILFGEISTESECYYYQLVEVINQKLQNVVDDYVPISPLSNEERVDMLKKWIVTLNEKYYYGPIKKTYCERPDNDMIEEDLDDAVEERKQEYNELYDLFVECAKSLNFYFDYPNLDKTHPIQREMFIVDVERTTSVNHKTCYEMVAHFSKEKETETNNKINQEESSSEKKSELDARDSGTGELSNGCLYSIGAIILLSLFFLIHCSNVSRRQDNKSYNASNSIELIDEEENTSMVIETKPSNPSKEEMITSRVEYIFNEVYKNDDCTVGDSMFLTTEYENLLRREKEVTPEGYIGFLDYDHWIQAQDCENPSMTIRSIEILSDTKAKARIKIKPSTYYNDYTNVELVLIYENDDWYIDDFIGIGGSEKQGLKDYIASKDN